MEGLENVPKFLFQHRLKVLVKPHTEIIMPKRFVRGKRKKHQHGSEGSSRSSKGVLVCAGYRATQSALIWHVVGLDPISHL